MLARSFEVLVELALHLVEDREPVDGFGGAVGEFNFDVSLDRQEAAVNDAVALRMVVSGEGSLQTVDPPEWEPPTGIKVFDPESRLETEIRDGRLWVRGGRLPTLSESV